MKPLLRVIAFGVVAAVVGTAWAANAIRLREARARAGQEVTVKGRTGVIVESAPAGTRVYTLRDDYGDQANVVCTSDYPIMGATYLVTGLAQVDPSTQSLTLVERSRQRLYGTPRWLFPAVVAVVIVGVSTVAFMLRRRALAGRLPEAWGRVLVVSGPDEGKQFELRTDEVKVGREQDSAKDIALPRDSSVSRNHGTIFRRGKDVVYRDDHSKNGSFLGQKALEPGQEALLPPDVLLRLGPNTMLRVVQVGAGGITETRDGTSAERITEAPTQEAPSQK